MNIKEQLLVEHSKENTNKICAYIGNDKSKLDLLITHYFAKEYRISQRSAMVLSAIFDHNPNMVKPYINQLIDGLKDNKHHVAIKRNTIRILQFVEIPEDRMSELFDLCLENIISVKEPIAVKAFSMTVLLNVCKKFPELKLEVIPILELELERNESAGVINRGKKVLKALHRL